MNNRIALLLLVLFAAHGISKLNSLEIAKDDQRGSILSAAPMTSAKLKLETSSNSNSSSHSPPPPPLQKLENAVDSYDEISIFDDYLKTNDVFQKLQSDDIDPGLREEYFEVIRQRQKKLEEISEKQIRESQALLAREEK